MRTMNAAAAVDRLPPQPTDWRGDWRPEAARCDDEADRAEGEVGECEAEASHCDTPTARCEAAADGVKQPQAVMKADQLGHEVFTARRRAQRLRVRAREFTETAECARWAAEAPRAAALDCDTAAEALARQATVQDAYHAAPDAGGKQFMTSEGPAHRGAIHGVGPAILTRGR